MRDLYVNAIESARDISLHRDAPAYALSEDTGEFAIRLDPALLGCPRARRIVIADDNRDMVDSLKMLLEIEGHRVYSTYDGMGAIRLAKALQPDFLLLDIAMPNINGYDVARQIRAREWGHDMRIVAITGRGLPEDRARATVAGFDFHLTKPVRPELLNGILAARPGISPLTYHPA